MRNPTYAGGFETSPIPERIATMQFIPNGCEPQMEYPASKMLSIGVKTITHNRVGLAVIPHKVVAVEMSEGDELGSIDLSSKHARAIAKRLIEFADSIDGEASNG